MNIKINTDKKSNIEIFESKPFDFNATVEVAACYIEIDDQLLLLQQSNQKEEVGKWGVPAGKVENERLEDAAKRELFEETGIHVDTSQILYLSSLYIRKPKVDYIFHLFDVLLEQKPEIHLSDEHQSYKWASINDIQKMALMLGAEEALDKYKKSKLTKAIF